ncbi:MAG TPA: CbtB-domain containing protein [Leptolyngbyaceae cyanobacterium]
MFGLNAIRDRKQTQAASLPVPLQMGILCSLAGLVLWTVYFSPYPAVHNTLHHTRHTTLGVACH